MSRFIEVGLPLHALQGACALPVVPQEMLPNLQVERESCFWANLMYYIYISPLLTANAAIIVDVCGQAAMFHALCWEVRGSNPRLFFRKSESPLVEGPLFRVPVFQGPPRPPARSEEPAAHTPTNQFASPRRRAASRIRCCGPVPRALFALQHARHVPRFFLASLAPQP